MTTLPKTDLEVHLPAGLQLPDGTILTYPPSAECDCAHCTAAYRALERGELRLPGGGLPWAA